MIQPISLGAALVVNTVHGTRTNDPFNANDPAQAKDVTFVCTGEVYDSDKAARAADQSHSEASAKKIALSGQFKIPILPGRDPMKRYGKDEGAEASRQFTQLVASRLANGNVKQVRADCLPEYYYAENRLDKSLTSKTQYFADEHGIELVKMDFTYAPGSTQPARSTR